MQSLSDVIAFNDAHAAVALKYGQHRQPPVSTPPLPTDSVRRP